MVSERNVSIRAHVVKQAVLAVAATSFLITVWAAAIADIPATRVLGQRNFFHKDPDFIDGFGFNFPTRIAIDANVSPTRIYISDTGNNRVLGWKSGSGGLFGHASAQLVIGQPDLFSNKANQGLLGATQSTLSAPGALTVDAKGNLYVVDAGNNRVLEYNAPFDQCHSFPCAVGDAKRVFGQNGSFTSSSCIVPGSHPTDASHLCFFNTSSYLGGLALDNSGRLYIGDTGNNRVVEFNAPLTIDYAQHVFGQPDLFSNMPNRGGNPGAGTLYQPQGIAFDRNGNLLVADTKNSRVLEYRAPTFNVSGSDGFVAERVFGQNGSFTQVGGNVSQAGLSLPVDVVGDSLGRYEIMDAGNNRVVEYDNPPAEQKAGADFVYGQGGTGKNFTGNLCGTYPGFADNDHICSGFPPQGGVAFPGGLNGTLFVVDLADHRVLGYAALQPPNPHAGGVAGQIDFGHNAANFVDGKGFNMPQGAAIDRSVTPNRLFVADTENNRVLGWSNAAGFANGAPADLVLGQHDVFSNQPDRGQSFIPAANSLWRPNALAVDKRGNLFVSDLGNSRVLVFVQPYTSHNSSASMVFGQNGDFATRFCDAGGINRNSLCQPGGVAVDSNGNVYIADPARNRVLGYFNALNKGNSRADIVFGQQGNFTTYACNKGGGLSRDSLCGPTRMTVDSNDDLLISDETNSRVLRYKKPFAMGGNTHAETVFGSTNFTSLPPSCFASSNNGPCLNTPGGVAVDSVGDVFISDIGGSRVLEFKAGTSGPVSNANEVIGQPDLSSVACNRPFNNPGPNAVSLCMPMQIALNDSDALFVADTGNNRVMVYDHPIPAPTRSATRTPTPSPSRTKTPTRTPTPKPT